MLYIHVYGNGVISGDYRDISFHKNEANGRALSREKVTARSFEHPTPLWTSFL